MSKGLQREEYLSRLRNIDPYAFQEFVAELWERQGYDTEVIRDEGVHILAQQGEGVMSQGIAIQTRRRAEDYKVDSTDIAQFIDVRRHDDVESVVVVTTSTFTEDAADRANREGIKLVNGDELEELIREQEASDLIEKYEEHEEPTSVPLPSEIPAQDSLKQIAAVTGAWTLLFVTALVLPFIYPNYASLLFLVGSGGGLLAWLVIPVVLNRDAKNLAEQDTEYQPSPTIWAVIGFLGAGIASAYYLYRRVT